MNAIEERYLPPPRPYPELMDELMDFVARRYQITKAMLKSRSREHQYVWPRQLCMWTLYTMGYSSVQVGRLSALHHTTCLAGYRHVEQLRSVYPSVAEETNQILQFARDLKHPTTAARDPLPEVVNS